MQVWHPFRASGIDSVVILLLGPYNSLCEKGFNIDVL